MTRKIFLSSHDKGVEKMFRDTKRGKYEVVYDRPSADMCVFVGGVDIQPSLYGEEKLPSTYVMTGRDALDRANYDYFIDIPKVGICRGGQFMNVMNGGEMWQHVDNHVRAHKITDLLFKTPNVVVTSTHHQMMVPAEHAELIAICDPPVATKYVQGKKIGLTPEESPLRAVPRFDTEVVWYKDTQSLCFQPHPEIDGYADCRDYFFDLIEYFFP